MSSLKIHRSSGYSNTVIFTGAVWYAVRLSTPIGWILASGKTIGSGASGATERANDDCEDLFKLLWNDWADAEAPVIAGRGANADADWTANKQITVADGRGRVTVGKDDMGGAAANRITVAGCGIDGTVMGKTGGAQTIDIEHVHPMPHAHAMVHTHSTPDHQHRWYRISGVVAAATTWQSGGSTKSFSAYEVIVDAGAANYVLETRGLAFDFYTEISGGGTTGASSAADTGGVSTPNTSDGGSTTSPNVQPTTILNMFIKL